MTSTRELLTEIESALATADDKRADHHRQLAERFEEASTRLAEKLGRCDALWREGRFDEARQAARRGGELREAAELARFREADAWSSWCRRMNAPVPTPVDRLKLEAVLERLAAGPSRLEQLLREYRRMALGRAPLVDRLQVLRAIAKADPDNPAWTDDQRAFEAARHEELAKLVREASSRSDAAQLRRLKTELTVEPWLANPPANLLQAVDAALGPLEVRAAEVRYGELADSLRAAHGALDEARCRGLLEEWEALAATTRVASPQAAGAELAPVRGWLRDLDEQRAADHTFADACAALESALDAGRDLETLERLAAGVLRLERGMPPLLGTRTASRMDELRRARKGRFALKLVGFVACAGLVGGVVAASWQHRVRGERTEHWAGRLQAALAGDDLAAARKLLDALAGEDAAIVEAPALQALRADVLAREQAEAERVAGFLAAVSAVEEAGVAHVDLEALLKRAEALAASATERALVEEWRHRRVVHLEEQRAYRDQALAPDLERLVREFEALRQASALGAADVQERAAACLDLGRRLSAAGDASPRLRERAAAIVDNVERLLEQALGRDERQRQIAEGLARIQRTIDPEALAEALQAFARSFPDHPRATEFVKAAASLPEWRAIEAWRSLVVGMGAGFRVQSPSVATSRRAQVEAHLARHPRTPHRAEAERLLAYFKRAEEALEADGLRGLDVLREVLETSLLASCFVAEDREGRRYYLLEEKVTEQPRRTPTAPAVYVFDHVVNARLTLRKKVWNTQTEGLELVVRRAPQTRFVDAAQRLLASPRDGAWETLYLKLVEAVLAQEGLDPILCCSLVRLLSELGRATTPFVAEDLEQLDRELRDIRVDVAWMDPDAEEARPIRSRARSALGRLPPIRPLIQAVEGRLSRTAPLWPVGVHVREVHLAQGETAPGELFAVTGRQLRRIGKLVNGVVQLEPTAAGELVAGSLVFAVRD